MSTQIPGFQLLGDNRGESSLVLPRMLALIVVMPLLVIYADLHQRGEISD